PEAFANALRQIAAEQGAPAASADGDEACGPDGCKV
ncbi:DsbA family oxidoreductase, partial [Stenotrophomonas geniculata]|nr:DsbA family oxidoreductase [Stenotrophomonas geniculata]